MKDKIITIMFLTYIFLFSILGIVIKDKEFSFEERRKLASFPNFTLDNTYVTKIDKYFLDHFPFRSDFRGIKANYNYNLLNMNDNNGIYLKDNYIFKLDYKVNENSVNNFINKTSKIQKLLTKDNKTYFMIVPDKNYYLEDKNFLKMDYNYLYNLLNILDINIIDIRNNLSLEDYYETDTHFKQEKLDKVILEMSKVMNFDYENIYYRKICYDKFYGVYYSESALKRNPETLCYLTNNIIDNSYVNYLENKTLHRVYNLDNLNSFDLYEVYLDGASSFIEIYNYNNTTGKELVIFRDSFGSSLAPLLINYYSKITLIDNRYINSDNFLNYINFSKQDVLFMYSTLIINNSGSLKG